MNFLVINANFRVKIKKNALIRYFFAKIRKIY